MIVNIRSLVAITTRCCILGGSQFTTWIPFIGSEIANILSYVVGICLHDFNVLVIGATYGCECHGKSH